MSRNPLPESLQDTKGVYLNQPDRRPQDPPEPEGDLPTEPPAFMRFTPKQKAIWHEVVTLLAPGVGKSTDILAVESLVILKSKERCRRITTSERSQLITLYSRFALTPSDRTRVSVSKKPVSKLDKFLSRPKPSAAPEPLPTSANHLPA